MLFCYQCNQEIEAGMKFCPHCGQNLLQKPTSVSKKEVQDESSAIFIKETYPYIKNPQWRNAHITLFISFIGFLAMIAPFIIEIDIMEYGGAMIMLGLIIGLSAFIVYFLFRKRAKLLDDIIQGKNILLHWIYDDSTWQKHNEEDLAIRKTQNRATFIMIMIFMILVVGGLLIATKADEGAVKTAIFMFGLLSLIAFFAFLLPYLSYKNAQKQKGEAILNPSGLWLSGVFHSWQGFGTKLESFQYVKDENLLEITYSAKARHQRQFFTVRLPIPPQQEPKAKSVANFFLSEVLQNNHKKRL